MKIFVLVTFCATLSACAYDATFQDCTVHCMTDGSCPNDLTCGGAGICRTPGVTTACPTGSGGSEDAGDARDAGSSAPLPSCIGLAAICGPNADNDCCSTATTIPDGTFYRSYDVAGDGMYSDMSYPATVSAFRLDKYEVTVGRFRKFVEEGMGTQGRTPSAGSGAHTGIPGSGWDPSWNGNLVANTAALIMAVKCDASFQTWTDAPGTNENLPINCITWYEALAFCAWDGGYLPAETEWNYAAAGGSEQRAYPWSNPTGSLVIDCSYANYSPGAHCVNPPTGAVNRAGSESPKGDGKWGQADLGGNVLEWTLDGDGPYSNPCGDCANLANMSNKSIRGGSFPNGAPFQRGAARRAITVSFRGGDIGLRCARPLPMP